MDISFGGEIVTTDIYLHIESGVLMHLHRLVAGPKQI